MKLGGHAPERRSEENGAPRKGCTQGFGHEDDFGHAPEQPLQRRRHPKQAPEEPARRPRLPGPAHASPDFDNNASRLINRVNRSFWNGFSTYPAAPAWITPAST